ncbi:MAG: D-alanine--D-alanine ligase family protein [Bacillota bacterium]|nr:D-alanine--D-alanine ligase family protein [Bacillota bacterium]
MIHIGVFFGGKSVEHEVSVITAQQAIAVMREMKGYHVVPIYIAKTGDWYTGDNLMEIERFKDIPRLLAHARRVYLGGGEQRHTAQLFDADKRRNRITPDAARIDIAFPIVHGTGGEDGTLQGLFELLEIPYIGCNPLAAALSMDKVSTKAMLEGIRQTTMCWLYAHEILTGLAPFLDRCEQSLVYPMIVKPSDLGSSVGVKTAHNRAELEDAIRFAAEFSTKIIVENKLTDLYEINISVLGDREHMELSVCERPKSASEFLTYEDKYMGSDSAKGMASLKREIPADIPDALRREIETAAREAFRRLDCAGVCRIDFLVDRTTETPYLCELNTIPGSLAFYLWEATGKPFRALIADLIEIAYRGQRRKQALIRSNSTNLLARDNLKGIKK